MKCGRFKLFWQGFALVLFLSSLHAWSATVPPLAEWTMINVNSTEKQGDAHLLQFPDGATILIDTGDNGDWLIPVLKEKKIAKLDMLIISHGHHDHYGAMKDILQAGISVKSVYFNIPPKQICDSEIPWGCNYSEIKDFLQFYKNRGVPLHAAQTGKVLYRKSGVELKILYAYDGIHMPYKEKADINDTSMIILLKVGENRVLFTGDLNRLLGTYLAKNGKKIHADILKVPHHGTEGVAPNEFFDAVKPKVALIPSPLKLWQSDRSKRVRDYFESHPIDTFINGRDGHVSVRFQKKGFTITTAQGERKYH